MDKIIKTTPLIVLMLLISWALFILSSSKLRKLLFEFKKTWPIVQAICKPIEKIIVNIIYQIQLNVNFLN